MSNQPKWVFVDNIGDASPLQYGGVFIYTDASGVYPPECVVITPPEEAPDFPMDGRKADPECGESPSEERNPKDIRQVFKTEIRRFIIEPCTFKDGILSDNKFHPEHPAWFAKPEKEREARPQNTTYLKNLADQVDETVEEFAARFLDPDVRVRARAWIEVGQYHGFANLDEYPHYLTEAEAYEQFKDELAILSDRRCRGEHKTFCKVWAHHPRACFNGMSAPDSQVFVGQPPEVKEGI